MLPRPTGYSYCVLLPCPPCSLYVERILWSRKAPALPLTVFTQATINRLYAVRDQCASYSGPMAAAVHVALVQDSNVTLTAASRQAVERAVSLVEALFKE